MPQGREAENTIQKPRAVNVFLLPATGESINLVDSGLIGLTFDRLLSSTYAHNTGALQMIDITMFTKSMGGLSSYITKNNSNLRLRYGFDNQLSPIYDLQIVKIKTTRTEAGTAFALGAVGREKPLLFPGEIFKQGVKVKDVLTEIAERNGWEADIDCDLRLPKPLLKKENQTDMSFINDKILPLANSSVIQDTRTATTTTFWEYKIFKQGPTTTLYFKPRGKNIRQRRVWTYSYGTSENNSIINMTQDYDMSHLIKGLKLKIASSAVEQSIYTNESLTDTINDMKDSISLQIEEIHKNYNMPMVDLTNFHWTVELTEDVGDDESIITELNYESLKTRILNAIDRAVRKLHTIEITVTGNPEILPTDLIELLVMNLDGNYDWLTAPGGNSSYWRVITITENIGLDGYTTTMSLVREYMNGQG